MDCRVFASAKPIYEFNSYEETTTIQDELFVLQCIGTAVTINPEALLEIEDRREYSSITLNHLK